MNSLTKNGSSVSPGFALVVVLAFIVLLTGLAIAYYTRTTSDRQVAHSSFNQSKVDQLAASAMDSIIGDVRQEIINGSTVTTLSNGTTLYTPTSTTNMLPTRSPTPAVGATPAILNLVRRSVRSDAIQAPALASRASAVNSTANPSANGRSITLARWNSHYLIPKSNRLDDKSDPITTGFTAPNYWAPDWVFVKAYDASTQQGGATAITSPSPLVIGRYAYAIYDEGGLLDANSAGYPSASTISQYGRKGSLAFADLSGLPGFSSTGSNNLVGWRNYASAQPSGSLTSSGANLSFTTTAATNYFKFILSDPTN